MGQTRREHVLAGAGPLWLLKVEVEERRGPESPPNGTETEASGTRNPRNQVQTHWKPICKSIESIH